MSSTKLLASVLLVLAVMFAQVGNVVAAPQMQEGTTATITGTIQTITVDPNTNTVLVTVLLEDQVTTQTVSLDPLDPAYSELFNPDTQALIAQVGDSVAWQVNSADVVPDEEPTEESFHPIAWLLAEFFGEDPSIVEGYHEDGFGFGVIAQSLWMSQNVGGDASLAGQILEAKQSGNYSNITLSDGTLLTLPDGTIPTNWGQFKKALLDKKNNLGVIVSGQADPDDSTDPLLTQQQHGNGKDKNNKDNNGKGKDKNKNHP
ncbi:MAG TPA: hypothetical protein VF918_03265 [Anaerolineales bacterium]